MMRLHSVIIAVVALGASTIIADDNLDESKAVDKIQLLGGTVTRDKTLPEGPVIGVSFAGSKRFNEKHLHLLKAFKSLATLDLLDVPITDVGLKEIGQLTNLTTLRIRHSEMARPRLAMLRDLNKLTKLTLVGRPGTPWVGLADLRESLPKLQIITWTTTTAQEKAELIEPHLREDRTIAASVPKAQPMRAVLKKR